MDERNTESGNSFQERFELGEHLLATRTAEAVEGIDRRGPREILFWTLRHPIADSTDSESRFVERLEKIKKLRDVLGMLRALPELYEYGVDRNGIAYLVSEYVPGYPLVAREDGSENLLRYFEQAVGIVAALHDHGVMLGDICEESFIIDPEHQVVLVALTGSFEVEARKTAVLPPQSTLPFMSPEQRMGTAPSFSSDVFALGMLGYRLLARRYPFGDRIPMSSSSYDELLNQAPSPSSLQRDLPTWVDDLIGKALETKPEGRYSDARVMLKAWTNSEQLGYAVDGGGRWSQRTVIVRPKSEAVMNQAPAESTQQPSSGERSSKQSLKTPLKSGEEDRTSTISAKFLIVAVAGLTLGVIVAGIIFLVSQGGSWLSGGRGSEIESADFAPQELKPALHDLRASGVSSDQKLVALQRVASSDNPVAFSFLVQVLKEDLEPEIKREGYKLIVEKIRRQGLSRTADVLDKWFQGYLSQGFDPAQYQVYSSLLRACDLTLPLDTRRDSLHKGFADDRKFALQLTAGLALDDPDVDHFLPILRQLLVASGTSGDLVGHGPGALILSNRTLALFFDREIVSILESFTPGDLAWSMTKLADADNSLLYEVAKETIRRNIVPPYQGVFLRVLIDADRYQTPKSVKVALVKAAQGQITESEVTAIANWQDMHREDPLLAIAAISQTPEQGMLALNAIAARSVLTEPAAKLIEWVQKMQWSNRGKLAKSIGILGHLDIAEQREIDYAFDQLMPFSADGSLLKALIKTGKGKLITEAIARMAAITPSDILLGVADIQFKLEREARIAAIRALKDRNDVQTLSIISQLYKRETDPEVRAIYEQEHWVVRGK